MERTVTHRATAPAPGPTKRGFLSRPIRSIFASWSTRIRTGFGRRATALVLTLLIEGLLALLLLTLAPSIVRREEVEVKLVGLNTTPASEETPARPESETPAKRAVKQAPQPEQAPQKPVEPQTAPAPLPWMQLSRNQMAVADIGAISPRPAPPTAVQSIGPPDTGTPGDTPRVAGQGPHGEPLYAASWYREPRNDELSGYLSTAQGPGWGLIACRTVADYRVEDCVAVDEYPQGSNITRSVLAAAWQFRVRPPRVGGRSMIGEWVRIRIDYALLRR